MQRLKHHTDAMTQRAEADEAKAEQTERARSEYRSVPLGTAWVPVGSCGTRASV